ncbi:MAG: hypothetical protein IKB97_02560 [Bacteroidaceae bacterium]|nr:hypothetical protein [Bacteroidaceae bacterium]
MRRVFEQEMNEIRASWRAMSAARKAGTIYAACSITLFAAICDGVSLTALTIAAINAAACLLWIIKEQTTK